MGGWFGAFDAGPFHGGVGGRDSYAWAEAGRSEYRVGEPVEEIKRDSSHRRRDG